nr:hypothetical protein [Delftia acidovorans]
MAIRLHGSVRTTPRIRAELQLATGSHRSLAQLYGINPKAVAQWRARTSVLDEPMGPRDRASQHLSQEQEHLAIALRKRGHLSLDDLMGQLLETAPKHIDSAEMKISSGKQHMFVAIDRVTKFTHVEKKAYQAVQRLDERHGRAHEPDHQGVHDQGVWVGGPGAATGACPDIRSRLQLRQALECAQEEDAIPSDLRGMGERSRPL